MIYPKLKVGDKIRWTYDSHTRTIGNEYVVTGVRGTSVCISCNDMGGVDYTIGSNDDWFRERGIILLGQSVIKHRRKRDGT